MTTIEIVAMFILLSPLIVTLFLLSANLIERWEL